MISNQPIMIIYIPDSVEKLEATVKSRLTDPANQNATRLFIKLEHFSGSATSPNEKVLLSQSFIDMFKEFLPKKIKYLSIDEGDFSLWMNKANYERFDVEAVPMIDWLDETRNSSKRVKPPLNNHLLHFFDQMPEQITELDLSQSYLYMEKTTVIDTNSLEYEIRKENLKAIIYLLKEKPLTYLAFNQSSFDTFPPMFHLWIKKHLPPTLHTIKLDNFDKEIQSLRHLLYFTKNIKTLDMSCRFPVNNYFQVTDRTINKDNVPNFINLFSQYITAQTPLVILSKMSRTIKQYKLLPDQIKTIDLSHRNLHKWAISINQVPIADDAHHFITELWRSIPRSVSKLILKGNKLASLSRTHLARFFEEFPSWVSVELSNNGFNQLPFSELNQKLAVLPNISLEFATEELFLRQDNQVVFIEETKGIELGFSPFHKVRYQSNVEELCRHELRFLEKREIKNEDLRKLLSYIPHNSELSDRNTLSDILKVIAGPVDLEEVNLPIQERLQASALERIQYFIDYNHTLTVNHEPRNTTLNLSYARLGCLNSAQIKRVFESIPVYVTKLVATNNGFAMSAQMLKNLTKALNEMNFNAIAHIDFSCNHFFDRRHGEINAFLKQFAFEQNDKILLSLSLDTPTTPYNHRCRLHWHDHYQIEAKKHTNLLSFAQVLLKNYTSKNNAWVLFFYLEWGQTHVEQINQMNGEIENGNASTLTIPTSQQLYDSNDVLVQLNGYQESSPNSDLARRLAALSLFAEVMPEAPTARGRQQTAPDTTDTNMLAMVRRT